MAAEVLGALGKVLEREAGVVVWIEVVTPHQVIRVGTIIHDGVHVVGVVAHVNLDEQPLRVERHERFLAATKAHIQANAVRADLLEER